MYKEPLVDSSLYAILKLTEVTDKMKQNKGNKEKKEKKQKKKEDTIEAIKISSLLRRGKAKKNLKKGAHEGAEA
jgi:hypothetical protein